MRTTPLALILSSALVFAACGGDDSTTPETTTTETTTDASAASPEGDDTVLTESETSDGGKPDVQIPDALPTELVVTVLREGSGREAANGDTVVVDYVGVRSEDGTEFDNSFDRGQPFPVTLGSGGVIAGWDQGLLGVQTGSRVQLDIPADLAYGDRGSGDIIKPGDALTFVVDVRAVVAASDPADAPDVEVTASVDSTEVVIETLVEGDGAEVVENSTVFVQLIAYRGDNLDVLDNTWEGSGPFQLVVTEGDLVAGLYEGLLGMNVGGRRVVTIPYEDAWGAEGNGGLGLPPATDLIIVIDVVAAY